MTDDMTILELLADIDFGPLCPCGSLEGFPWAYDQDETWRYIHVQIWADKEYGEE